MNAFRAAQRPGMDEAQRRAMFRSSEGAKYKLVQRVMRRLATSASALDRSRAPASLLAAM